MKIKTGRYYTSSMPVEKIAGLLEGDKRVNVLYRAKDESQVYRVYQVHFLHWSVDLFLEREKEGYTNNSRLHFVGRKKASLKLARNIVRGRGVALEAV